jgi:hypothetical protein
MRRLFIDRFDEATVFTKKQIEALHNKIFGESAIAAKPIVELDLVELPKSESFIKIST